MIDRTTHSLHATLQEIMDAALDASFAATAHARLYNWPVEAMSDTELTNELIQLCDEMAETDRQNNYRGECKDHEDRVGELAHELRSRGLPSGYWDLMAMRSKA